MIRSRLRRDLQRFVRLHSPTPSNPDTRLDELSLHLTRAENEMEQTKTMDGRVIAVRGAVVDVVFDGGVTLPPIDDALVIMPDDGTPITVEVQAHVNESTVSRCSRPWV